MGMSLANAPRRATMTTQASQVGLQSEAAAEPTDAEKREMIAKMVPELQEEMKFLQRMVVPSIKEEVDDVRKDLDLIVSTLRKRVNKADSRLPTQPVWARTERASSSNSKLQNSPVSIARSADASHASPWTAEDQSLVKS